LFSARGKIRMGMELVVPKRQVASDESIADFVRRRFGDEAVTYVAEPLLAGIHAGDAGRLSMRALFPRLVEAEARTGSVIRAFRRQQRSEDGAFRSLPGGIGELVDALVQALPPESLRFGVDLAGVDIYGASRSTGGRHTAGRAVREDSVPVHGDGRVRISPHGYSPPAARYRFRGAESGRAQHHGSGLGFIEMGWTRASGAGSRTGVPRRRPRPRSASAYRRRPRLERAARSDEDPQHRR
jgi:hypothetical protein